MYSDLAWLCAPLTDITLWSLDFAVTLHVLISLEEHCQSSKESVEPSTLCLKLNPLIVNSFMFFSFINLYSEKKNLLVKKNMYVVIG